MSREPEHVCWGCMRPFNHEPVLRNIYGLGDIEYCTLKCMIGYKGNDGGLR